MAVVAPAAAALLAIDIAETVLIQIVGQLVASVVGVALAPELLELQQLAFRQHTTRALDVALSVDAVIKGHRGEADGVLDAAAAGYTAELFKVMVDSAGEPIPLLVATEAWRRGIIPKSSPDANTPSLEKAIRDSRLKNVWIPAIEALQFQLPPVGTIIEGWLRAQITPEQALDLAYKSGVDKDTATLMFKAAGRPPSPAELFTLWNRGVIPEKGTGGDSISVDQGYLETDLKDKWLEPWKKLREYRPPPRTITALQRAGAITDDQALTLYQQEGLTPELAAIYVKTAHHERSAATKELTKAEWLAMYVDQAIDAPTLKARLATLGFTGESADLEIQLADLKVAHALEQRAVNRVGTLYTGRRIDKTAAMNTLQSLKLPAAQVERLLAVWTLERSDNLKHLPVTELGWAVANNLIAATEGLDILAAQGYGPRDAWVLLAHHSKVDLGIPIPSDNLPPA